MKSLMPPKAARRSDIFQTPTSAVDVITPYIPQTWRIWECAAGKGRIVDHLRGKGYDVHGTDIGGGFDFLNTLAPLPEFDCILTNPPYSLKDKWLRRCYALGKPFALLLPITSLGESRRCDMFREHGIQLVMPPGRTHFETPSGRQGGAWFFSAWFCRGLDLPSQIVFTEGGRK